MKWIGTSRERVDICFGIGSGERGGAEIQLVTLANKIAELGFKVHIAFMSHVGPLRKELLGSQVTWSEHRFIGISRSRFKWVPTADSFKSGLGLVSWYFLIWKLRPKVSHFWLEHTISLGFGLIPLPKGTLKVAAVRGEVTVRPRSLSSYLYKRGLKRAQVITYNSQVLCNHDVARFPKFKNKCEVVPNGLALPAKTANVRKSPVRAIVVANFRPYKGHATLMEAIALLDKELKVVLCGQGEDGKLLTISYAKELGILDKIIFPDQPVAITSQIQDAQFAIHPSETEGLSNAILEELAGGLPVIACDVGGNAELVQNNFNGILVQPRSSEELCSALRYMVENDDERERMSLNARSSVERFAWSNCVQAYLRIFNLAPSIEVSKS